MDFFKFYSIMGKFWLLGTLMILFTWNSKYSELIKLNKENVKKWAQILVVLFLWRIFSIKYLMKVDSLKGPISSVKTIPWQACFFVYWEDAVYSLPILIADKYLQAKKYKNYIVNFMLLIAVCAFSFGHAYQGISGIVFASIYLTSVVKTFHKYGLGTVMACHVLYDLSTIWAIRIGIGML